MLFSKPRWDGWGNLTEHLKKPVEEQKVLGTHDGSFTVEKARRYHEATYSIGMQDDVIRPIRAINKELNLQFVLGYTAEEFARSLQHLADGRIPVEPMVSKRYEGGRVVAVSISFPYRRSFGIGPGRLRERGAAAWRGDDRVALDEFL